MVEFDLEKVLLRASYVMGKKRGLLTGPEQRMATVGNTLDVADHVPGDSRWSALEIALLPRMQGRTRGRAERKVRGPF
jgi:hypothetical protein